MALTVKLSLCSSTRQRHTYSASTPDARRTLKRRDKTSQCIVSIQIIGSAWVAGALFAWNESKTPRRRRRRQREKKTRRNSKEEQRGAKAEDKTRQNGPLINEPDYAGVRCDLFNVTGSIQFPVELIRVVLNELQLKLSLGYPVPTHNCLSSRSSLPCFFSNFETSGTKLPTTVLYSILFVG